jgi:membrane protease YdiL (CAAX protease family)
MTAAGLAGSRAGVGLRELPEAAKAVVALAGLAAVVAARWALLVDGRLDGITIGLLFGLGLVAVGVAGGRIAGPAVARPTWRRGARDLGVDLAVGTAGGLALIAIAILATTAGGSAETPVGASLATRASAGTFGPWLGVTVLVALAEELVLRGVLFGILLGPLDRRGGAALAFGVTAAVFALMHVPVYGWHVVPLDLGVGVFLGGLRLATGRWPAAGIAHAVADIATWWL